METVGAPLFSFVAEPQKADYSATEAATGGGRWAALADWLQSQPGGRDDIPLTFNEIEEITNRRCPRQPALIALTGQ